MGGNSSFSVCEEASLVAAFTLNITSVLCIICNPSITLGCSGSLGLWGGEIVCDITLGDDGGDDSGVVSDDVFVDMDAGDWALVGVNLFDKLGDKDGFISGIWCDWDGVYESDVLIGGGGEDFGSAGGDCLSGDCRGDCLDGKVIGELLVDDGVVLWGEEIDALLSVEDVRCNDKVVGLISIPIILAGGDDGETTFWRGNILTGEEIVVVEFVNWGVDDVCGDNLIEGVRIGELERFVLRKGV